MLPILRWVWAAVLIQWSLLFFSFCVLTDCSLGFTPWNFGCNDQLLPPYWCLAVLGKFQNVVIVILSWAADQVKCYWKVEVLTFLLKMKEFKPQDDVLEGQWKSGSVDISTEDERIRTLRSRAWRPMEKWKCWHFYWRWKFDWNHKMLYLKVNGKNVTVDIYVEFERIRTLRCCA